VRTLAYRLLRVDTLNGLSVRFSILDSRFLISRIGVVFKIKNRNSKIKNKEPLAMPNDAKLGLIAGVTIVIVVAVVFFRKEPSASVPRAAEAAAVAVGANSVSTAAAHR
jgi:hypothetical protein